MSGPLGSQQWMYATETPPFYPYTIDNSLRFDGASKLTATPPSVSNRGKFTISCWVKRSDLGADQRLFEGWGGSTSNWTVILFDSGDSIQIQNRVSGSAVLNYVTSAKYRDTASWYHIVARFDLASTGLKVWVNGEEVTQWSASTFSTANTFFNSSSYNLNIGYYQGTATQYLSGYMADTHFVDNQALSATDFGELKSGIWVPKEYTGTYGTNGFHLDFADNTSAAALGYDAAGSNDFTPSGIATSDQMLDSPTNNFATLNPIANSIGPPSQLSEGNTRRLGSASSSVGETSTFFVSSGSYYFEVCAEDAKRVGNRVGIWSGDQTSYVGYRSDGNKVLGGSVTAYGASYTDADIISVAFDADASTIEFFKNGVSQGQLDYTPSIPAGSLVTPYVVDGSASAGFTAVCNFGQDSTFAGNKTTGSANATDANGYGDFYYTPPSGHLALCTQNLPDPTFDPRVGASPQDHFSVDLDADGSGALTAAQAVFPTGIWWLKNRTTTGNSDHLLVDSARGSTLELNPNAASAESTYSDPGGSSVAWSWKAASAVSGTTTGSGTLKSYSGYANATAGVSVITYEGNGTAGHQIPHHLGAAPSVVVVKSQDEGTRNWIVYHANTGASPETEHMVLNGTAAAASSSLAWNNTAPSASVVTLGSYAHVNNDTYNNIMYAFAEKDGFSKFGVYQGNFNADGPFVYLGFRPAFVMIKATGGTTGKWCIFDAERDGYNVDNDALHVYPTAAEDTTDQIDLLSNGFKLRGTGTDVNSSTYGYIYMAFAEQPFKYANAR